MEKDFESVRDREGNVASSVINSPPESGLDVSYSVRRALSRVFGESQNNHENTGEYGDSSLNIAVTVDRQSPNIDGTENNEPFWPASPSPSMRGVGLPRAESIASLVNIGKSIDLVSLPLKVSFDHGSLHNFPPFRCGIEAIRCDKRGI